jgi:hypothetical protein
MVSLDSGVEMFEAGEVTPGKKLNSSLNIDVDVPRRVMSLQ